MSAETRSDEFPPGAQAWPGDLDRRDFLRVMGASLALAGVAGCARPRRALVPYVAQPDSIVPGKPAHYATAVPVEGYARGVIVETHEGRPAKIEGNPRHSESLGAADAISQASVLSLYDPDRSRSPRASGLPSSWAGFESEWSARRGELGARAGSGLALLSEPTTSPTVLREIHRLLDRFPMARWYQHTPLARYDEDGVQPDLVLSKADVLFSVDADFLHRHPAALRHARAFAGRRRVENGRISANRLYVAEPAWSITGSMADHRLAVAPARMPAVLNAVAAALSGAPFGEGLAPDEREFVAALSRDLRNQAPRVACIAGAEQGDDIRRWVRAINRMLGTEGGAVRLLRPLRSDGDARCAGDLGNLVQSAYAGRISTLVILGANPVHTAPADLEFERAIEGVFSVHVGPYADETAALCRWHLPESHALEAWSDLRGFDGSAVIQQPLIEPMHGSRSSAEILRLLADPAGASGYDLVRETWLGPDGAGADADAWTRWLNEGVVGDVPGARPSFAPGSSQHPVPHLEPSLGAAGPTVLFRPDPTLADGRFANNGWLQELPRPFTTITWDNAVLLPPGLARALGLGDGDLATLRRGPRSVRAPIWIAPGQAEGCIVVHLGGGRTAAGSVGDGRGFSAYPLRPAANPWQVGDAAIAAAGGRVELAATQHHFSMESRHPARLFAMGDLPSRPEGGPDRSLYPAWERDRYAWGMAIDLSACIGCSACVIACQAENNIPVVGKEQVLRGREMHWIRIDRYFTGGEGQLRVISQPVPCMQCENAPCELVCPVGATVHSSEGLNEMVYNRCVGTRYCSNNCPYKVRRFNFFDFRAAADSPLHLQENPGVTVRTRGVMEKCTYCVQRINAGRIVAEREGRRIRDGEIRTACQQACPAEAIVFGDISDPDSAVSRRKGEPGHYALLAELNTRPRTTYQPKLFNPA